MSELKEQLTSQGEEVTTNRIFPLEENYFEEKCNNIFLY
jgi:hypothetical protein